MARPKRREYFRDFSDLTAASVGISIGSSLDNTGAVSKMGSYLPMTANVVGGNILLNTMMDVNDDLTRKMKRRRYKI